MRIPLTSPTALNEARQAAKNFLFYISDTPQLDADILIADVCKIERSMLDIEETRRLDSEQAHRLNLLLGRRLLGEPIAYLTSVKEFWSLPIRVNQSTLIPRPDTELLVERMLHRARSIDSPWIADLGTGSGAVALAVASELPKSTVVGTDTSAVALQVASDNRSKFKLNNIYFVECSWAKALQRSHFDVIGSNPPYIRDGDACWSDPGLKYEPREALSGGKDGLDSISQIVKMTKSFLKNRGWLILEHGWDQGDAVRQLMEDAGYQSIETYRDLTGNERVTECCNEQLSSLN